MVLRKCPRCHDMVGAESPECPRCGVNFRAALFRRLLFWIIVLGAATWCIGHYGLKVI